jgi:hypothetical protein
MTTEGNQGPFPFHPLNQREIRGQFDGGSITTMLGFVAAGGGKSGRTSSANSPAALATIGIRSWWKPGMAELLAQLIYGLALGYEYLNDHEELRRDPLLAVLVEKEDLPGKQRRGGGSDAGGYFFASVRSHSNCPG